MDNSHFKCGYSTLLRLSTIFTLRIFRLIAALTSSENAIVSPAA